MQAVEVIGLWAPKDGSWPKMLGLLSDGLADQSESDFLLVGEMRELIGRKEILEPAPDSQFQLDDDSASPYAVSHAARHNFRTGVLQLDAAQELFSEGPDRLIAAATLLRSSLEALAVAFWIAHPAERSDRVARSLAWHLRNVTDERAAFEDFSGRPLELDTRDTEIRAIAKQNGIDVAQVNAGAQSTGALRYADSALGAPNQVLLYSWRLCSGVAHARPWALANFSASLQGTPGVRFEKVELDSANLLVPLRVAVMLLNELVGVLEERTKRGTTPPPTIAGRTDS